MSNFTCAINGESDHCRYVRHVSEDCWISVLYRLTGFGWHEWETAICFRHPVLGRERTWRDQECLIIAGDRRVELETMPKEQLRDWYKKNIEGNRNSMDTFINAIDAARKEAQP